MLPHHPQWNIALLGNLLLAIAPSVHPTVLPIQRPLDNDITTTAQVLILGGGVAGVIAARTLSESGIEDFIIVEAREELGGRLISHRIGGRTVEVGANWVQGTQSGSGPANPLLGLARKHDLRIEYNDCFGSISTYDQHGPVDYLDIVERAGEAYANLTVVAGGRVSNHLVDATARTGYNLIGAIPRTAHEQAAEYLNFDWEYAQKPDQTSWIASSWANNYTFEVDGGGFSEDNMLSIDQRGFKHIIQKEAETFLKPRQLLLNSTVQLIRYSDEGVVVTLSDGRRVRAEYAINTFSLGVLQYGDVTYEPPLPDYKLEAIHSMTMGTYTKIFMKFPYKFWFDTEMALYADPERGRYPVWQSLDHKNFYPGSGLLFVTVTGDFAQRVEALPFSTIKDEVMGVLRSMYPNMTIPDPLDFHFHRWNSDPLFRGSYSNWPPSFFLEHQENIRANVGRLYFAGEATSKKHFGEFR
ncbi:hypothetical protein AX16_001573 [Volvariella volvacea WC 439]|nr:hypothetical protein AX16_001573 [Volvariella volvacea WC 439]